MTKNDILKAHSKKRGKIEVGIKMPTRNKKDLAISYTPGVAEVSKAIAKNKAKALEYTNKANQVAIITDGTAVLGLGNIGPEAAIPVMEGKVLLFKEFAGIDATALSIKASSVDEIVNFVKALEPSFAGINLEDISAPRCFAIERALWKELDIPIFHDDQHGTAIVALAALINAAKLAKKDIKKMKVVISGAGAAGIAITNLFYDFGIRDIVVLDSRGILSKDRKELNIYKKEILKTNKRNISGGLKEALLGADAFVGVSKPGILKKSMIKLMADKSIVFAMANPIPEIMPDKAKEAGAFVAGTGRSDFPNQINNAIIFPGLFRAVFDAKIKKIDTKLKLRVAEAVASHVTKPSVDNIVPDIFDKKLVKTIVRAIKKL